MQKYYDGTKWIDVTGTPVIIDSEFSETSTNALQNKVITLGKQNTVYYGATAPTDPKENDIWVYKSEGTPNACLPLAGGLMQGPIDMGANKVMSTYTPVDNKDLVNKGYTDNKINTKVADEATLRESGDNERYTKTESDTKYPLKEDVYTKTESNTKFVAKATGAPTLTANSGWKLWATQMIPIGGNFYYLNITVRNDTGSAQGAADYPVIKVSGNPIDCALATACFEAPDVNISCVIQAATGYDTKVIKFRCGNGVIPAGAYIPISGVVQWDA